MRKLSPCPQCGSLLLMFTWIPTRCNKKSKARYRDEDNHNTRYGYQGHPLDCKCGGTNTYMKPHADCAACVVTSVDNRDDVSDESPDPSEFGEPDPEATIHMRELELETPANLPSVNTTDMADVAADGVSSPGPFALTRLSLNKTVIVKLTGAREISGRLQSYDSHCNLVLRDVTEKIDTVEEDEDGNEYIKTVKKQLERLYVRGESVVLIAPDAPKVPSTKDERLNLDLERHS